ncbi:TRAP transporter substrate-binding protein [Thalassospira xianhensis]|uniref:C4-dicarboxylate ABC transporter substrate-binding protein n=1 Tax=Thalassospira xianhensis MCCC 1A02616 TaxID=1177929 RepID=A0A367UAS8_9PROT|nr:TRAP transporter substrate-binding protein [Thalassospira xianhensis]RCK04823.1 C4-dicarboxylate ABC transporter substrate-binding protein [Thalassospira xianhensis MCCC 1A02616]
MKNITKLLTGAAVATMVSFGAHAQEVTLTIHHFLGPKAPAQAQMMEPWAKKIEEESNGRIKFEIFPSMSLGGNPPELYRQVRDGVADIVWTLPGYTPGVFPHTEVFELPGVHLGDARATNLAIWDMMEDMAPDLKDIHPLAVHVHAGQAIHLTEKEVRTVADVKGLKLRTPTRTGSWVIESWGAEPVGMPVPALPQAMSLGVVDGGLVPFEVVPPLKLAELVSYSVEGQGVNSRFGTSVFLFAMNKDRYDSLPDDLKEIIDRNSGRDFAAQIGDVFNNVEEVGKKMINDGKGQVVELTPEEKATFDDASASVVDRWIEEAKSNGIDGAALVEKAKAAVLANTKQ